MPFFTTTVSNMPMELNDITPQVELEAFDASKFEPNNIDEADQKMGGIMV